MDPQDEDKLILMMKQASQTAFHTSNLISQALALHAQTQEHSSNDDDSTDECESDTSGVGRGYTADGLPKALYASRLHTNVYMNIRKMDPDVTLFEKTIHLTRSAFDDLHALCVQELLKPMNVRNDFNEGENSTRVPRRRRLKTFEMLFMFLDVLGGPNEGGLGVERVAHKYGVSPGTVSNYFRHALFSVIKCLDAQERRLVRWPTESERQHMEGLVIGFPKCVFFVDGNKNRRWRPKNNHEQERAYDGYKYIHGFAILVFCDLFGRFIRVEISDKGAESDRNLYTDSDVYTNPEEYLSAGQHGMADSGFQGPGALVVPYKRNQSTDWMYRTEHNRDIRKQRMVNEWGIGFVNNRYRLFLGRWPFSKDLFPVSYKTAVLLSNWLFDHRGYALQPRERYEQKLARD